MFSIWQNKLLAQSEVYVRMMVQTCTGCVQHARCISHWHFSKAPACFHIAPCMSLVLLHFPRTNPQLPREGICIAPSVSPMTTQVKVKLAAMDRNQICIIVSMFHH